MEIMKFTDSIGDTFEIRHVVKISRRKGGKRFIQTNDNKWYAEKEFNVLGKIHEGDIIATRDSDGDYFAIKIRVFNNILAMEGLEPYDYSKFIIQKSLPKGL